MCRKLTHKVYSVDPFSKKDYYDVKAPSMFSERNCGKTLITKTQGTSKYLLLSSPIC